MLIDRFSQKLGAIGDSDSQGLRWQVIGHGSTAYDDQQVASWRAAWEVVPLGLLLLSPPAALPPRLIRHCNSIDSTSLRRTQPSLYLSNSSALLR